MSDAQAQNRENLLFEVCERSSGHWYRIYIDGSTEGFEEGAIILNHALIRSNYIKGTVLRAKKEGLISAELAAKLLL